MSDPKFIHVIIGYAEDGYDSLRFCQAQYATIGEAITDINQIDSDGSLYANIDGEIVYHFQIASIHIKNDLI